MFLNLDIHYVQLTFYTSILLFSCQYQLTTRQEEDVRDQNKTALFYNGYWFLSI